MHATKLGHCPICEEAIPLQNKLIEFETPEGWTAMFAECANCSDLVHPR